MAEKRVSTYSYSSGKTDIRECSSIKYWDLYIGCYESNKNIYSGNSVFEINWGLNNIYEDYNKFTCQSAKNHGISPILIFCKK